MGVRSVFPPMQPSSQPRLRSARRIVRSSVVCALASERACMRAARRAAQRDASRKKEQPAKKRVGTPKKKKEKAPCVLEDHHRRWRWESRARSCMKERKSCVRAVAVAHGRRRKTDGIGAGAAIALSMVRTKETGLLRQKTQVGGRSSRAVVARQMVCSELGGEPRGDRDRGSSSNVHVDDRHGRNLPSRDTAGGTWRSPTK